MSYIDKKISQLFEEQKALLAQGERLNPVTKKLWQDCMNKKNQIDALCGSGQMTRDTYIQSLRKQVEKDNDLLAHFKNLKDNRKMNIVQERIVIVKEELAKLLA